VNDAAAADPYVGADVYAPARRALWVGPLTLLAGVALVIFGLSRGGAWALLAVPGGLLGLQGLLRTLGAAAVLLVERQRKRILREGVPATGVVASSERVRTRLGYPILEIELDVTAEDGRKGRVSKKGAVPPHYAGEFGTGNEIPLRVDRSDVSVAAIDWGAF
jgi:hypothetical protein